MARLSILFAALMLFITGLKSQVITITFEGTVNGTPTPLDSILVMNLTAGGDTTIYFPDHELVLGTTGFGAEEGRGDLRLSSLPNPFAGSTEVVLASTGGPLLLMLHDATGRELGSHTAELAAGMHRYRVRCERAGIHLLTAVQGGVRRTMRLMATEGAGVVDLSHLGGAVHAVPKADRSLFTWTLGDDLRYIGYATSVGVLHSAAIQEVPVASATRIFVMAAGAVCPGSPTVTDIDGNVYAAVQIGSHCWMAENLRTGNYRDGNEITHVPDASQWQQQGTYDAWCNYDNDPVNDPIYGKLYNWHAAADPNICPLGWHLPADAEWQQLELELGMPSGELAATGYRGAAENVGGKLKSTLLWNAPNTGATNESGFNSLPSGHRAIFIGQYEGIGNNTYWWTASQSDADFAWLRLVDWSNASIYRDTRLKGWGFCVRCLRD